MREKTRIILDLEAPTRDQAREALSRDLVNRNGIYIPQNLKRELDEYCKGCGHPFGSKKQESYFGETFCVDCVERWKHGQP